MKFSDLGLSEEILRAVSEAGYETPTPIQESAIPVVLMGRDVLGCAQTGTGKTASFTLPMLDILASGRAKARMPRSLILEPTRELAAQVADNFETYGKYQKLSKALLIGGSSMEEQLKVLNRGVDVLIATPGRLLDVFDRGHLLLTDVKVLVIDEADRMLDMGFIPDVEKIVSLLSPMRTTLFFSATMPKEIRRLADKFLSNPKEISVSAPSSTSDTITQGLIMVTASSRQPGAAQKAKRDKLRSLISEQSDLENALVFCNRKRDVDVVYRSLEKHGLNAARLHGDMVQSVRMDTLDKFKNGEVSIMVCSDVAARGLDIPSVGHVFNFDVPTHAEDYVHRIGRTGRAGRSGKAFTFSTKEDAKYIRGIEQLIGKPIPLLGDEAASEKPKKETAPEEPKTDKPTSEEKEAPKKRARGRKKDNDNVPDKNDTESVKNDKSSDKNDKESGKEDAPAAEKPAQDAEKKPRAKRGERSNNSRRDRGQRDIGMIAEDESGWGDGVPAFLTREVDLPKK